MTLHPHIRGDHLAQKFVLANEHWNLEKLYKDIANAKQQERHRQCKQLTPTEKACLRGLLCDYSPTAIATELNREPSGLRVELSRGLYRYTESLTGVCLKSWSNIPKHLEKVGYKLHNESKEAINLTRTIPNPGCVSSQSKIQNPKSKIDWGEAIDVSIFYGRTNELNQLQKWVIQDKCRLIALLGMGGIGKTALSVKLAQLAQDSFEFVIWHSLRDSPPPTNY
jgi:flagellar biosynthesis GTPase FlhF